MKYTIYFIGLLLLTSCGSEATDSGDTSTDDATTSETSEDIEPLSDPCQVSASEITAIMGVEYSEGRPNAINSETMKVCDYGANVSGSLSIGFNRHSNLSEGALEASFQSTLEKTSEKMTYQEVEAGLGDQAIYFFGEKGPNHVYTLQWRLGNHTSKRIFLSSAKERNAEETLTQLKEIANKVKN